MFRWLDAFQDHFLTEKTSVLLDIALYAILGLSTLFTLLLVTLPSQYDPNQDKPLRAVNEDGEEVELRGRDGEKKGTFKAARTTQVVVLGDIGRSPRMQYHAISLAKHGARVYLIGYQDSELHPDIVSNPLITIVPLSPTPSYLRSLPSFLLPLKALHQFSTLYHALAYSTPPARHLLVQNPPSIPTLLVASLVSFLRNTTLVIDWHNFGYSILALKLGATHPLVALSKWYEAAFARLAAHHFTVTHAMARVLKTSYRVSALTLHDRPAALFQPISPAQRTAFLTRLPETKDVAAALCAGRMKLVVSSTSWTPDEDFSLLLSALTDYAARSSAPTTATTPPLPPLLALITGKGPQKDHYLSLIARLNAENKLSNVTIRTAWLSAQDYATLLGAADLGVSLHTSSSGVDLPMKVVDMFGAGLPVVGWGAFEAWPELVREDVNGKGFRSAEGLAALLVDLFGEGEGKRRLEDLREGARVQSRSRWDEEWDRVGGRLFGLVQ